LPYKFMARIFSKFNYYYNYKTKKWDVAIYRISKLK